MDTNSLFYKIGKIKRNYKLYISMGIAILSLFPFKMIFPYQVAFLLTWITFSVCFLSFSWITILSFNPKQTGEIANLDNSNGVPLFLFIVLAAFISLFTIIFLVQSLPMFKSDELSFIVLLPFTSIFLSWILIHSVFTLWYAHKYYSYESITHKMKDCHIGGLEFPQNIDKEEDEEPDFLDFAYFSFVIGMTFQVSDIEISSKRIRRIVLLHGFLSFVFNTIIVALTINIVSSIVGK